MKAHLLLVLTILSLFGSASAKTNSAKIKELVSNLDKVAKGPTADVCDRTVSTGELHSQTGEPIEVSVISEEYAIELFNYLAKQDIPFRYPEDGCYARAHKMSLLLDAKGITTGKVFIEGDLKVKTQNSPAGEVSWWYHVAPVIKVKKDGREVPYVFDPSIFDRPVPEDEWFDIQTKGQRQTYYTKRFGYQPFDRVQSLTNYRPTDLQNTTDILKTYSEVVKQRDEQKKKNSNQ